MELVGWGELGIEGRQIVDCSMLVVVVVRRLGKYA